MFRLVQPCGKNGKFLLVEEGAKHAQNGRSSYGMPNKTWEQVFKEDFRVKGLRRQIVQSCAEWRYVIA